MAFVAAVYIFREIHVLKGLHFYKKQGIEVEYYPFMTKLLLVKYNNSYGKDLFKLARKRYKDVKKEEDIKISVDLSSPSCIITPLSDKALKEYFSKELKVAKKSAPVSFSNQLGFFYKNGPDVEKGRALMSKIFRLENLKEMTPALIMEIRKYCEILKNKVKKSEEEWVKIDIKRDILNKMFEDISTTLLLGSQKKKFMKTDKGKSIMKLVQEMFLKVIRYGLNPLRSLSFGYAEKLGLVKELKEAEEIKKKVQDIVTEEFNRRTKNSKNDERDNLNFMDLIIEEIKAGNDEKKKIGIQQVCSLINLFQFAASDTSFHGSSSFIFLLADPKNKKYQDYLRNELKNIFEKNEFYTLMELNENQLLDRYFKETLRILPPVPLLSKRKILKNFKLCGFNIRKGDIIQVPVVGLGSNEAVFPNHMEFRPERHKKENSQKIKRLQLIPFGHGNRNCVGKVLGEMMVKTILCEFLSRFEFRWTEGFEMNLKMKPLYGVANSILEVRNLT